MRHLAILFVFFTSMPMNIALSQSKEILYAGTFAERGSKGIYVFEFNRDELSFSLIQTIGGNVSPSFLDIDPKKKYLFSVNRTGVGDHERWGSVTSYRIHPKKGKLSKLNVVSAFGTEP